MVGPRVGGFVRSVKMKNLYDISIIQIEVTNACNLSCANCTRFVGHHKDYFFMDLETVRKAVGSLNGFPGKIGIMGGEPTLHPQFREICHIFQQLIPDKDKRGLWTNGYKWKEYEALIYETFQPLNIVYNDHTDVYVGDHQPLLIAAKDILDDQGLMWKLIDKCWVNQRWSASITPKGCFFCEVAAAQDHLFNGPGGYPIEAGWWNKTKEQYRDQVQRYCVNCSAAIPMPRYSAHSKKDLVSKSIAEKLQEIKSPRYLKKDVELFDKKLSEEQINEYSKSWMPWSHRPYKQYGPDLIIHER